MRDFSWRSFLTIFTLLALAMTLLFVAIPVKANDSPSASKVPAGLVLLNKIFPPPPCTQPRTIDIALLGLDSTSSKLAAVKAPPAPKTEPCQHCHISGEEKGIWTPLWRWVLFGGVGLMFTYGVYRSASMWTTRRPWKPLTARAVEWVDERYQVVDPLSKVLAKPVPNYARRWFYCLGGITAFLFIVQATTGIMLAFYYNPNPASAYASIQYIESQVRFGSGVRMIHSWAANAMIVACAAHMLRVFIMGAYKKPRELNWVSGFILFIVTLAFGFTGYLLPWDQRAFWATTVGSEIAGAIPVIGDLALVFLRVGWDVTGQTLSRFYALHIIILPVTTLAMMGMHFLMVRRQGIARPL